MTNIQAFLAVLDQRLKTTEQTNTQMLDEFRGLRTDIAHLWRETAGFVSVSRCEALCGRRDTQLLELGEAVRGELKEMAEVENKRLDGMDDRLRDQEQATAGIRAGIPLVVSMLSLAGVVGLGVLNFLVKARP